MESETGRNIPGRGTQTLINNQNICTVFKSLPSILPTRFMIAWQYMENTSGIFPKNLEKIP